MTDRELMQQALEALESGLTINDRDSMRWTQPITALRERLAQPEMQPCAGRNCGSTNPNLHSAECFEDYEKATGMRAWQGLTDEDREDILRWIEWKEIGSQPVAPQKLIAYVEKKLKEKNT